jgi:hypothetical protein
VFCTISGGSQEAGICNCIFKGTSHAPSYVNTGLFMLSEVLGDTLPGICVLSGPDQSIHKESKIPLAIAHRELKYKRAGNNYTKHVYLKLVVI